MAHTAPRRSIRLSQNFLKDFRLIESLVLNVALTRDDTVFEIGPGHGIITQALANVCHKVVAIEVDPQLAALLKQQFTEIDNVEIINTDVLKFQFPATSYKIFSNIPFNITADILRKLLYADNPPSRAYLIIQREAAEKYSGSRKESQASILLKPWYKFNIAHEFERSDFEPVPSVEVVLLDIEKLEQPLVDSADSELYRQFVTYGFGRQKASLGKNFKNVFTHLQWKRLAQDFKFNLNAGPTDISFEQWYNIFQFFIRGIKNGVVKIPSEMLSFSSVAKHNVEKRKKNNSLDQRWKNRKAKQKFF